MVTEFAPVLHEYVAAPPAVKFSACPTQTVLLPEMVTVKLFVTVTVATAEPAETQPKEEVPETV